MSIRIVFCAGVRVCAGVCIRACGHLRTRLEKVNAIAGLAERYIPVCLGLLCIPVLFFALRKPYYLFYTLNKLSPCFHTVCA
jgi:hypothetical protein